MIIMSVTSAVNLVVSVVQQLGITPYIGAGLVIAFVLALISGAKSALGK